MKKVLKHRYLGPRIEELEKKITFPSNIKAVRYLNAGSHYSNNCSKLVHFKEQKIFLHF
jgi:hypothetical protein